MKTVIFLSFFLIQTVPAFAAPDDELHVEGISYEAQNEATSIAVINGEFFKEGDMTGHYKIMKIGSDFVRVIDQQSNAQADLSITGSAPKVEASEEVPAALPVPTQTPESVKSFAPAAKQSPETTAKPAATNPLSMLNPLNMINMANEVAVFAALKQIHMTAMAYQAQEGEVMLMDQKTPESLTIQKLIDRDMISNIYANEYKGYRFSIKSKYDNIQVFADPAVDGADKKHYLVDRHGVMRVEKGKQATDQSPPQNA